MPPPLTGYNNNVRHRGRIFHIQTEDSGLQYPRIMTHLFADGGRIVKSTRTDYAEHVGRDDMTDVVRSLMKEQHKAMFVALRCGELDALIGFDAGEPPASLSSRGARRQAEDLTPRSQADQPSSGNGAGSADAERADEKGDAAQGTPLEAARTYAAPRPASIFGDAPQAGASLFGEAARGEKSLDEAILSYLSEDTEKVE